MKKYLIIIICIIIIQNIQSQISTSIYLETGENYASSGIYADITGSFSASIQHWQFETTAGITLTEARENIFNALSLDLSRAFKIKEIPLSAKVFYQWKPFSERLHEQNAGFLIAYNKKRFGYQLGLNTRIFNLTNQQIDMYNYEQTVIWEPINLMYKITYSHPFSDKFDFRVAITNFDAFIIQQETNPMLITNLIYHLSHSAHFNLGVGYLQSGLMNMRVNYFGYFIRGGIQWDL
jgi:hypothetical protein